MERTDWYGAARARRSRCCDWFTGSAGCRGFLQHATPRARCTSRLVAHLLCRAICALCLAHKGCVLALFTIHTNDISRRGIRGTSCFPLWAEHACTTTITFCFIKPSSTNALGHHPGLVARARLTPPVLCLLVVITLQLCVYAHQ